MYKSAINKTGKANLAKETKCFSECKVSFMPQKKSIE